MKRPLTEKMIADLKTAALSVLEAASERYDPPIGLVEYSEVSEMAQATLKEFIFAGVIDALEAAGVFHDQEWRG